MTRRILAGMVLVLVVGCSGKSKEKDKDAEDPKKIIEKALKAFQEEFYSVNVEMLAPLLKEKAYTLSTLDEIKVDGKPAVGVKVSAKGHRDIELYFDKESHLPVKTVRFSIDPETRKEATAE